MLQLNRNLLLNSLRLILMTDLRFCQMEDVEQHFWKIAFLNVIEALWKALLEQPAQRLQYQTHLFSIIIQVLDSQQVDSSNQIELIPKTISSFSKFLIIHYKMIVKDIKSNNTSVR